MTIAETASNFNQAMLRDCLQKEKADDKQFQIAMLDEAIFNYHRYFFIMPTLARFELEISTRLKSGKSLSTLDLNQIMGDALVADIDLNMLKTGGVDMTSRKLIDDAFDILENMLDRLEALCGV